MATAHHPRKLCAPCSALTFTMLRDGYTHLLTYRETIKSGETCALCRLMIYSTGKLSVNLESYKVHYQYNSLAPRLPELLAVSREERITSGLSPVVERLKPLAELHWSTNQYICDLKNNWEARKGNFNDGETIQITAPADDESDWSQESRMMGTIFKEASCTIAAVDSVDDVGVDHGLFLPRDTDPLSFVYSRFLTRKNLSNKLSWSCLTESGEEEGGDPTLADRLPLIPMRRGSDRSIFSIWESIISEYQRCQLTFSKDRLAAIRGISARLEAQISCKIYAGILSQSLGASAENLLWYASKAPLGTFNEFHAPSWTWVAFDGEISFFMPTPCGTSELLIDRLDFKIRNQCESLDPSRDCKGTCVSGSVSFGGPTAKLTRGGKLKDLKIAGGSIDPISEREILAKIIGYTLVPGISIPRFDELGNMVRVPYNPPVPDHTEILEDECGCIIGFFIPDLEEELEQALGEQQIICVGVKRYQDQHGQQNDTIEIIGLREIRHSPMMFRRLGKGRVVCNAWLRKCIRLLFEIC
ncbi:hypothetical protein FVEG_16691 [Fusarium verticillioides 7600]|uniref:Heterokaryon incompatibility domain-containing protein n=1 Tax=Gibberella moniliformis (strain M3125 / FGSC 7600) TaxID=334819 RepID=W7MGG6_GIBM7|nr:hypothetical protein FVEG_16691 [Fusarium verticillioides 7600]EWG50793.1 hypothetical protein FVEG_16691 [Fusarium verticillioides 7600]